MTLKRSIKEDQLVTVAMRFSQWAQENFTKVIIGVAALIVAIGLLVFTANSRRGAAEQGDRQMGTALALLQRGDFEAAKSSFQQLSERNGGALGVSGRFFKAECELRQNNFQQALADYDRYLKEADHYPVFRESAAYGKAMAYEGLENYAEAALTLDELASRMEKNDPRALDARYQAGEFFARAGNAEDAERCFAEVAEKGTGTIRSRATAAAAVRGNG